METATLLAAFDAATTEAARAAAVRALQGVHANPLPCRHRTPGRTTPIRVWRLMTDAEWDAIRPYVERPRGPGRPPTGPLADPRFRLDMIFAMTLTEQPWAKLHPAFGRGDTLGRTFRRWTHAGLWKTLLFALARTDCPKPLKRLEYWICRAARRAMRLMGEGGIALARLLGLNSALPLPPFLLPDREMSEWVQMTRRQWLADPARPWNRTVERLFDGMIRHYTRHRPWTKYLEPA